MKNNVTEKSIRFTRKGRTYELNSHLELEEIVARSKRKLPPMVGQTALFGASSE